jgi:hypothetical protein
MQQFRTTVSAVFWTETPDESEGIVAAMTGLLAPEDQSATLATVDYMESGRPVAPAPPTVTEGAPS